MSRRRLVLSVGLILLVLGPALLLAWPRARSYLGFDRVDRQGSVDEGSDRSRDLAQRIAGPDVTSPGAAPEVSPLAGVPTAEAKERAPVEPPNAEATAPAVGQPAAPPAARRETRWKFLPPEDADQGEWRALIAKFREEKNVVGLQAVVEARPGATPRDRAYLLAEATRSLAQLGKAARPAFDDLLESPHRDVRFAAMSAFAANFGDEREVMLASAAEDPDPVVRAKAKALQVALSDPSLLTRHKRSSKEAPR
jgi:hypothetical protein